MQGVSLIPATGSDLDLIMWLERAPGFREFMLPWPREKHQHAMADSTYRYLLMEARSEAAKDIRGFVILQVLGEDRPAVEIIRIAANPPGSGIGEHVLALIKTLAFDALGARKLWLDVFDYNERARHVYRKAGFVDEA
ncbi:MAG: GNAT family N-acetyltransferase, partial [Pseudomonadota bacterium]